MSTHRLAHKPLFALLAVVCALALGACGDSHTNVSEGTYAGESGANAPYLNVGPLIYEVQLSRELNPYDTEDSAYLQGLTPEQAQLHPGEEWFGVFMQVYNNTSTAHPAATLASMRITDTQGLTYTPLVLPATNDFAYRAGLIPPKSRVPAPNTVASFGPIQGALLLYKIKIISLDNRPLKIHIVDPLNPAATATAILDV
jgi:hypothetical protein